MFYRHVLFIIACISATAAYSQSAISSDNRLEDGTPVKLRLQRTISSADAHVDERIDFDVLEEVRVNGTVVIPKGGLALGTVTAAQPKRRMARGGKLDINIDSVRLVNGDKAALRAVKNLSGGGHTGAMTAAMLATSLVVWPAAPFFLFMHGKDITVPKGTEITAYVNGSAEISSSKGEAARSGSPAPVAVSNGDATQFLENRASPGDPSTVIIRSNPDGGEITVDGKFVGSTPSTVQLSPGEHALAVQQSGFKTWQRKIAINSGGIINLNAVLEKDQ
jgi:PEGA domain-containing protein